MAQPIPAADAALLAAQAQNGQAGVDAYRAAQAEMQTQRQGAVQQAMQEAALRGAPTGAMQSIQSTITGPYDQRIAGLGQASAAYQADMAARDRRMGAYSQAVQGARTFIPEQTEQIVAPIRAQGEYAVRGIERQGQMRLQELEGNLRLTQARMAAEFQAAQIAAAKKAAEDAAEDMELTQGELTGLMTDRAPGLFRGGDRVREILSANQADIVRQGQGGANDARSRGERDEQTNLEDLKRAQILIQAAQFAEAIGAPQARPQPPTVPDRVAQYRQANPYVPESLATEALTPYQAAPTAPSRPEPRPDQLGLMSQWGPRPRTGAAREMAMGLIAGVDQRRRDTTARTLHGGISGMLRANREYTAIDEETGRRVAMSPGQVESLDPFTREMLMGATQVQPINGPGDFEDVVWGTPTAENRGIGSQYSSDVVRAAMRQVAEQLQAQGYDIDEPAIANAMPGSIPSIYNLLAGRNNQPSSEEEYAASEAEREALEQEDVDEVKATMQEAQDNLAAAGWGREPPPGMDEIDFWNLINDPEAGPQIEDAEALVQQLIQTWGRDNGPEMSFDEDDEPIVLTRDRLREALRQSDIPPWLWDIALMRSGY